MKCHWPNGAFWRTVDRDPPSPSVTMSVLENRQPAGSPTGPEDRLDSWKAIAAYLGRGVRTVQRWEREEGLPVHRLAHEKRGSVYAHKQEIGAWWESRRLELSAESADETETSTSSPRLERLTWASAASFWPALSSDGRLLAYVSDGGRDGTSPQIWLQQIGGAAVCLTTGTLERSHLAFSAGDTRLVFTARDAAGQHVYSMPTLGGEPRIVKRSATAGQPSPDGKWLAYVSLEHPAGIRVASLEDSAERTVAPQLTDVSFVIWSPDSKHILVRAHPDPTIEPDYWVAAIDGTLVANIGILQRLASRGFWPVTLAPAWVGDSLIISAITPEGVNLMRQRLVSGTFEPNGDPERLTRGTEFDCFPTAGGGGVAFVNAHPDQNLWSVAIDPSTGVANGQVRRLTRGPGIVLYLSLSRDGKTLAYFRARRGANELVIRNLAADSETAFVPEPGPDYGFPAISPSGATLAVGARMPGPRAMRPIFVATVADGVTRRVGEDCGGRPKQWIDERLLVIERFGSRRNSIAVLDTASGARSDLLVSAEHSVTNPRLSPDGRWIAFDAACPGGPPTVYVARVRSGEVIPRDDWTPVVRGASHPFWSADGSLLYYLPTVPSTEFRNAIRARRFDDGIDPSSADELTVFESTEMVVPVGMSGTVPVATRDQMILVLGDFRGDVWMLRLE
jgi:Tol biopolymer transport system component